VTTTDTEAAKATTVAAGVRVDGVTLLVTLTGFAVVRLVAGAAVVEVGTMARGFLNRLDGRSEVAPLMAMLLLLLTVGLHIV